MTSVAGKARAVSVATAVGDPGRPYTVIYDGTCGVCSRMVKVLENWDRNHLLEIIPSQAPGTRDRFPWISASAYADSIQVIRASDGETWQAGSALEELIKVLPRGRPFSWLFNIPLARPLADRFYGWFARNRHRMGCDDHCAARRAGREIHNSEEESR